MRWFSGLIVICACLSLLDLVRIEDEEANRDFEIHRCQERHPSYDLHIIREGEDEVARIEFLPGSRVERHPLQEIGVQSGDLISRLDGLPPSLLSVYLEMYEELRFELERGGRQLVVCSSRSRLQKEYEKTACSEHFFETHIVPTTQTIKFRF